MNWFEEQLRYRKESDDDELSYAIDSIADAVMGERLQEALSENEIAGSAIGEILKYYHCRAKTEEIPLQLKTLEDQIEYSIRPFGIRDRVVTLEEGWYHYAVGAMIGTMKEDGSAVVLIPGRVSGYRAINYKTGEQFKLNRRNEKRIDDEAICFYEPLPLKRLNVLELLKFMKKQLNIADMILHLGLMAAASAMGLLSPLFTRWLFNDVLKFGNLTVLIALAVFMVSYSLSRLILSTYQSMIESRIGIKQNMAVQAAVMNRILSLPPAFFKNYSAGELSQRASYVQPLCQTLFSIMAMTGLSSLFSLIYIGQIFTFAPSLVIPSLAISTATILLSLQTTRMQKRVTRERMEISAKTNGITYSTITGIQKIKLAGAEKRAFSRWARQYAREAQLEYNPPIFLKLSQTINLAISLIGTMVIYAMAVKSKVGVGDYYAFNTAYSMVSGAFGAVLSIAVTAAEIRPSLEMIKPIMEAEPEVHDRKENIVELTGAVSMSHVSFRYDDSAVNVIDDLSLRVNPGEYLAIVGTTGCGKSTLMRLMLGFETPQKGLITYDGKDISKIDPESLRRKIGVVMQDGKLFLGDIYSNIVITAPHLGLDAAWEAAEIASIADNIRAMPMGMNTMICEGQGGISGGQKQRLMIARAVAPKPRILMFDEATSALDNITQEKISRAIDSLNCTRIVIAHRLSTIRHADRIIYLDQGRIVEEGTYEELMKKNGYFAGLVERQLLDRG